MKTTSVYRTQCKTFTAFKEMLGLGINSDIAASIQHPITKLRYLPPYRDHASLELRKELAKFVLMRRGAK